MSLIKISKLVGTSVRELEKTYAHVLDKFMNIKLEGFIKHLKNSKIIAFTKEKSYILKSLCLCRLLSNNML